ncbi:MAG: SPL family radical SAM protein [Bacillota bacterium]
MLCKSALVRSGIPGVDYVINPYTGCSHACVYCYAAFMCRFSDHSEPWGRFVDAKVNMPQVLAKEVGLGSKVRTPRRGAVMLSSVTDPYQPVEQRYLLTRACLEVLAGAGCDLTGTPRFNVSILTKSDLVVRDIDVLQQLSAVSVGLTVTTWDDSVARLFEPGAPPPSRRFQALRCLAQAGLDTWGFFGPVLPGYSDSPKAVVELLRRFKDCGAKEVVVDKLNTYPHVMASLERALPKRALCPIRYCARNPRSYGDRLKVVVQEAAHLVDIPVTLEW